MKTIFIHIGRGKTGTTTIQRFLASHHRALLSNGIHYLNADGGACGAGHQNFAKTFIEKLPGYMDPPHQPELVRRAVVDEINQAEVENILLSSENFELADVAELHRYFSREFTRFKLKIIYFVRSQDELAESEYNQIVKIKGESRSFQEYIEHELEGVDYLTAISKWERYFGRENIICRILDRSRNNVISAFLSCLPITNDELLNLEVATSKSNRLNASIGYKALTIARLLNSTEIEDRLTLYSRLFTELEGSDFPALLFSSEGARRYRERFAESNREFTRLYFGEPSEDLGGRYFSDEQRDKIRKQIEEI